MSLDLSSLRDALSALNACAGLPQFAADIGHLLAKLEARNRVTD